MTKYEKEYKRKVDVGKVLLIALAVFVSYGIGQKQKVAVEAKSQPAEVKIAEKVVYEVPDTPEEYIKYKFGEYAPTAFKLLQGDGTPGACAENKTLDPYAVNYNWTKIEGKWSSRDRGIFQINDKFHPGVTDACAFDFKCNIDYAWRMFVNDGYTFVRWTCGRWYGI
jgi:hypothetical protein